LDPKVDGVCTCWETAYLETGSRREVPADRGSPLVSNNGPATVCSRSDEDDVVSLLSWVWCDRGYTCDRRLARIFDCQEEAAVARTVIGIAWIAGSNCISSRGGPSVRF
jgi:hypothetical protein